MPRHLSDTEKIALEGVPLGQEIAASSDLELEFCKKMSLERPKLTDMDSKMAHGGHGGMPVMDMPQDMCSMNVGLCIGRLVGSLTASRCSSTGTPPTSALSSAAGTSAAPSLSSSP